MNPLLLQMGPMIVWDIWLSLFFPGYALWTSVSREKRSGKVELEEE